MPRPVTVTPADIARWNSNFMKFKSDGHYSAMETALGVPGFLKQTTQDLERSWYPGEWLREQLEHAGCPPQQGMEIILGVARHNAHVDDPWPAAVTALRLYLRRRRGQTLPN